MSEYSKERRTRREREGEIRGRVRRTRERRKRNGKAVSKERR